MNCFAVHRKDLALAASSAPTKVALLVKSKADPGYLPPDLAVAYQSRCDQPCDRGRPDICAGAVHRKCHRAANPGGGPRAGASSSGAFTRIQRRCLLLEATATGLFYVIVMMWLG